MAEQQLDGAQIGAGFQQVNGEGVAQGVRRDRPGDARPLARLAAGGLHGEPRNRLAGPVAREQPGLRMRLFPVVPQDVQQPRREHDVTVLLAFAGLHPDDHAPAVDRAGLQRDRFGNAQSGRIADGQDGALLRCLHRIQKYGDLLRTQHIG